MDIMRKLLLIVGASGSGKSLLEDHITHHGFRKTISTTTREKRKGEINGVAYNFVSREEFDATEMFENVEFAGNKYGLTKSEFYKDNEDLAAVVEPEGMDQLVHNCMDFDIRIVFFDLTYEDRYDNMAHKRGDNISKVMDRLDMDNITNEFKEKEIPANYTIFKIIPMEKHVENIKELWETR